MNWGNPQTISDHFSQVLLKPLTWPYKVILSMRRLAYEQKWLVSKHISCPVISIGNLTVGGTGKTPIIIDLAGKLLANKIKVGILSRGYGRRGNSRCVIVGNGQGVFGSSTETGDEALMIAKILPEAVVIVDPDRVAASEKAISEFKCQVLLLDDGFQHWRLQRDSNIVLIDYSEDPSKDALLPAGRLREPLSALKRATHIVITKVPRNYDPKKLNYLRALIEKYAPEAQTSSCEFISTTVEQFISGSWQTKSIDLLKNMSVVAFCGIAKPKAFFESLKKTGAHIVEQISFADHHHYSHEDLKKLKELLTKSGAEYLITTRKDLIKLDDTTLSSRVLAVNQNVQWLEAAPDITSLLQTLIPAPGAIS